MRQARPTTFSTIRRRNRRGDPGPFVQRATRRRRSGAGSTSTTSKTRPLRDYYNEQGLLVTVDATKPIPEVTDEVLGLWGKAPETMIVPKEPFGTGDDAGEVRSRPLPQDAPGEHQGRGLHQELDGMAESSSTGAAATRVQGLSGLPRLHMRFAKRHDRAWHPRPLPTQEGDTISLPT